MAVTIYGVCAVTFMMVMYAVERRDRLYVVGFALGCVLSSAYGFLSGALAFRRGRADLVRRRIPVLPSCHLKLRHFLDAQDSGRLRSGDF